MLGNHPLGHITHLWRYPVKALAAEPLVRADVGENGIAGDRHAALFVITSDHARSGNTYRGKENNLLHTVASTSKAVALGRDRALSLAVRGDGPYFDLDPISILFDTWLAEAERLAGMKLEPLRYRPNILVRASSDFVSSETDLVGRTLAAGGVRLRVSQPIQRCVTTTYDVETGHSEPRVLAVVAKERDNTMGVYAHVLQSGTVACGDALELEGS